MSDMSEAPRQRQQAPMQDSIEILSGVTVRLSVEVGSSTMTLAEIAELDVGSVIVLDRQVNDPLGICANGARIALGEIVAIDGRYAIRIVDLVSASQRRSQFGKA